MNEKFEELKKLAEPISEWLASNFDPACRVVIDLDTVVVSRTEMSVPIIPDDKGA